MEKEENQKLRQLHKNKRAVNDRPNVEIMRRLKEEEEKAENYKRASQRHKNQAIESQQEAKSLQSQNKDLRDQVKTLKESLNRQKGSTSRLRDSREENKILAQQVDQLEDEIQRLKDQVEGFWGAIQVRPTPTPEQLYHAAYTIWRQEAEIREGKRLIREIAQKIQLLAEDASELHDQVEDESEEGRRIIWILREILELWSDLECCV